MSLELPDRCARILVGPISNDPAESVSNVNSHFIRGLGDKFNFVKHLAPRRYGVSGQGRFNVVNGGYFIKHFANWLWCLIKHRPVIAQYAITADWNLEKSLLFLRVAGMCGAKTLGHLHGGSFLSDWGKLPNWRKKLALRVLQSLDGMVVLSNGWRNAVVDELGLDPMSVYVVNNPIEAAFEHIAMSMPVMRSSNKVLCMGVMEHKKGVFEILAAAGRDFDGPVEFQLVGPEREPGIRTDVIKTIHERGLEDRVRVLGPVIGEAKVRLFREAAIFLLPSHVENFSLAIIEAAAAGLPIVSTRVGATPEFFEHGVSALFVDRDSPGQIANAVRELLNSEARRCELGIAARNVFISRLRRDRIMNSMAYVYDCVAGAGESGRSTMGDAALRPTADEPNLEDAHFPNKIV